MGAGLDVHPFTATDGDASAAPLVLCGVHVPDAPGLDGHSDADVGAHAVADALLGAAALGDLGSRFGVDRPETAGADSMELLRAVVTDVAAAGFEVGNVDLTIVAQRPRLAPHREAMRANLAAALHLDVVAVSVKFTTTDRLGTIGRGEGIAGWCSALLVGVRR
ncbi:MAG: 2-C-methyl-D-erythritol 2,4-cyclodiphosphate synthase [Nitriliruptoraceae bacterium]|nr:2-C-methyl-D-erythritol 2,4-cyclodiphosphate synthase [Nitriliruptoraceae bacterium]